MSNNSEFMLRAIELSIQSAKSKAIEESGPMFLSTAE